MRILLSLLLIGFVVGPLRAQKGAVPLVRVKVLLIGTLHLTPSSSDAYKNAALDLTSASRQPQVQAVVNKLTAFGPTRYCVEWPAKQQGRLDSLYQAYLHGHYQLQSDEIDQFAFRTAQQLALPGLQAVNYRGEFESDKVMTYAAQHQQQGTMMAMDRFVKQYLADLDEKGRTQSVSSFLSYLNAPAVLQGNASLYSNYYARIGSGPDYPGIDLVATWYATNLHIYANILRQVRPSDKAIIVLFGQGHIPILKSLFASNPAFEVVEVADVLH